MASFTVIYDACVLYPAPLRDLLIRIARSGIVRACWSDRILDEMVTAILRNRPELKADDLDRTRRLMTSAVEDSIVSGYEPLIPAIELPDPKDCHVVAAAIRASAQAIVTFNLRDFPDHDLERWNIEAKHPDEFVLDSIDIAPGVVVQCATEQAAALRNPPCAVEDVLDRLREGGLVRSVAALRDLVEPP